MRVFVYEDRLSRWRVIDLALHTLHATRLKDP